MTTDPQPLVSASPEGEPFWTALKSRRLVIPRCDQCGEHFFYPRCLCPSCGSRAVSWVEASGTGRLHAFCMVTASAVPGLTDAVPFATGLVQLSEGPRLMGFLRGFPDDPEQIRCDTAVRADFLTTDEGAVLLAFRPDGA